MSSWFVFQILVALLILAVGVYCIHYTTQEALKFDENQVKIKKQIEKQQMEELQRQAEKEKKKNDGKKPSSQIVNKEGREDQLRKLTLPANWPKKVSFYFGS